MSLLPDTRYSLLARLSDPGDVEAWSEFVEIYQDAIYRYSRSRGLQDSDAREVVQRVLLAIHAAAGGWEPSGRPGSFRGWLLETARRVCLRALRERSRNHAVGGSSVVERLRELSAPEQVDDCERDWQRWAFCWAAGQIEREIEPATWRAFWLTAVEGVSSAEAARLLEIRIGTVYAAKCRVLARIRQRVQELSRNQP